MRSTHTFTTRQRKFAPDLRHRKRPVQITGMGNEKPFPVSERGRRVLGCLGTFNRKSKGSSEIEISSRTEYKSRSEKASSHPPHPRPHNTNTYNLMNDEWTVRSWIRSHKQISILDGVGVRSPEWGLALICPNISTMKEDDMQLNAPLYCIQSIPARLQSN